MRFVIVAIVLLSFCSAVSASLIHRYSFNDGTANDSIGGANGILVNGATITNGQVVFDPTINNGTNTSPATGQYVDLPDNVAHARAMTLEAWFTFRGGSDWQRIVDFGNSTAGRLSPTDKTTTGYTGGGFIILTPVNGNGTLLGQISISDWGGANDTNFIAPVTVVSLNVEHHLVFTHDPTAGVESIYMDGVLRGQSAANVDPSTTNYPNWFLGRSNFSSDPFFNGSIDEFRIYDNAITASQVSADFQAGPSVVVPEPFGLPGFLGLGVVFWRLGRRR